MIFSFGGGVATEKRSDAPCILSCVTTKEESDAPPFREINGSVIDRLTFCEAFNKKTRKDIT